MTSQMIKSFFTTSSLLPSATKLRRLCFYRLLSVHRGGGSASVHAGIPHPPEQTPPWEQTHPTGSRHPPGADPPGADTPREQTPPEQTPRPPRYGHCCGRYASYWNAFLFRVNEHHSFIYNPTLEVLVLNLILSNLPTLYKFCTYN